MKVIFLTFFIIPFFTLTAFCQNLVPDPSFENYESCQTNLSQFDLLVEWYNPTPGESEAGSPDYYNACSASIYWGTTNLLGNQIPRTGDGMAGLLFADLASISEFIAIELTSELVTKPGYYQLDAKSQCEQLTSNLLITQECYCDLYIPDAFSPNEDLKNDSFSIYSSCDFELYEMTIYNRWGELVFKSNNSKIHWDGTYKNQKVQKGVYTYKLKYLYELPKII